MCFVFFCILNTLSNETYNTFSRAVGACSYTGCALRFIKIQDHVQERGHKYMQSMPVDKQLIFK